MSKSFLTKQQLMRFINEIPDDSLFLIGNQQMLDLEEEWDTSQMMPVRSLSFFRENDRTVVVFGMDGWHGWS